MKIIKSWPVILIKQSDSSIALRKTWVAKPGAIWVLPDDAIIIDPPVKSSKESDERV